MAGNLQTKPHNFFLKQHHHHQQREQQAQKDRKTKTPKEEYIQLNNNFTPSPRTATTAPLRTAGNSSLYAKSNDDHDDDSSYVPAAATPTKSISSQRSSSSNNSKTYSTNSTLSSTASSLSSTTTTSLTYKSLLAAMGSCLGRCMSKETSGAPHIALTAAAATTSCWRRRHATDEQDADLMSPQSDNNRNKRDSFIYRIIKFKSKKKSPQFIDKFWEHNEGNYRKLSNKKNKHSNSDIQLQNLDVNNLLAKTQCSKESTMNYAANTSSSRASSSLDLEWEHEYTHMRHYIQQHQMQQPATHQQQILVPIHQPANKSQFPTDNLIQWPAYQSNNSTINTTHDTQTEHNTMLTTLPRPPSATSTATNSLATDTPQLQPHAAATHQHQHQQRVTIKQAVSNLRHPMSRKSSIHNSWSHISTPESLEWDVDEEQQRQLHTEDDSLDHETLKLLHQIEQLKNQVLHETGDGLHVNRSTEIEDTADAAADDYRHYPPPAASTAHEIINFS